MEDTVHIVCPHCNSVNRLPTARMESGGRCGKCKQALFLGKPVELSGSNFAQHISRNDIPVVVDFWAPWCGPCKMMAPVFTQAAAELEPWVRLAKIDTQSEQGLAAQFGIRSIPTVAIFNHGHEVVRQAGAMDLSTLLRWVKSHTV